MKKHRHQDIRGILPFLVFSIITGFLSAAIGIAFKLGAEGVVHLSATIYAAARQFPLWIPALVIGGAALGLLASFIISWAPSCKGGGIPSSVAAVRGIVGFKWLPSILVLPFAALVTFLCGLPLGTEGPCVQMGTAIGDSVMHCFGSKKHTPWRRYVMTGGASAGFSIATASPISAILFSAEELHKKFSPLLLMGVSLSVITAQATAELFSLLGVHTGKLFHFPEMGALSGSLLFAPLVIGVLCGVGSILFTRCYHAIDKAVRAMLQKVSVKVLLPALFACVALVGIFLPDTLGTGHGLVEKIFETPAVWYLLLLVFLIRAIFMMTANTAGTTGGVFLPTLAFGAILGALCAKGMVALGWLEQQHYGLMVILGITAFLAATSRIPLTACVFAVEALGGIHNILPIVIAATIAFLTAKLSGVEDFTDAVVESKEHALTKGKTPTETTVSLTASENSFICGKELHDILLPHGCAVVSAKHTQILPGDVIALNCKTYDQEATSAELQSLIE